MMDAMEIILTCNECGHQEAGTERRVLIAKVRMLNHLNRMHPDLGEPFKDLVKEEDFVNEQDWADHSSEPYRAQ